MSIVDIANLFGLDPFWLGSSQTSAPYQNVQDAAVQLVRFPIAFWLVALEAQLSRLLTRGHEARFNQDVVLREQRAERATTGIALVQAGLLTVDEWRLMEGLPPLEPEEEPAEEAAPVAALFPAGSDTETNQAATGTG